MAGFLLFGVPNLLTGEHDVKVTTPCHYQLVTRFLYC